MRRIQPTHVTVTHHGHTQRSESCSPQMEGHGEWKWNQDMAPRKMKPILPSRNRPKYLPPVANLEEHERSVPTVVAEGVVIDHDAQARPPWRDGDAHLLAGDLEALREQEKIMKQEVHRERIKNMPPTHDVSYLADAKRHREPELITHDSPLHSAVSAAKESMDALLHTSACLDSEATAQMFQSLAQMHEKKREWHISAFADNLKPAGRKEVFALEKWMAEALSSTALSNAENYSERSGVMLMIYSVVVHDLIRQVSMQCLERGQLLDKCWRGILSLFDSVMKYGHAQEKRQQEIHAELQAERESHQRTTDKLHKFMMMRQLLEDRCGHLEDSVRVNAKLKAHLLEEILAVSEILTTDVFSEEELENFMHMDDIFKTQRRAYASIKKAEREAFAKLETGIGMGELKEVGEDLLRLSEDLMRSVPSDEVLKSRAIALSRSGTMRRRVEFNTPDYSAAEEKPVAKQERPKLKKKKSTKKVIKKTKKKKKEGSKRRMSVASTSSQNSDTQSLSELDSDGSDASVSSRPSSASSMSEKTLASMKIPIEREDGKIEYVGLDAALGGVTNRVYDTIEEIETMLEASPSGNHQGLRGLQSELTTIMEEMDNIMRGLEKQEKSGKITANQKEALNRLQKLQDEVLFDMQEKQLLGDMVAAVEDKQSTFARKIRARAALKAELQASEIIEAAAHREAARSSPGTSPSQSRATSPKLAERKQTKIAITVTTGKSRAIGVQCDLIDHDHHRTAMQLQRALSKIEEDDFTRTDRSASISQSDLHSWDVQSTSKSTSYTKSNPLPDPGMMDRYLVSEEVLTVTEDTGTYDSLNSDTESDVEASPTLNSRRKEVSPTVSTENEESEDTATELTEDTRTENTKSTARLSRLHSVPKHRQSQKKIVEKHVPKAAPKPAPPKVTEATNKILSIMDHAKSTPPPSYMPPSIWTFLMNAKKTDAKQMMAKNAVATIRELYKAKAQNDYRDNGQTRKPPSFPTFVYDHSLKTYGLKALGEKHLLSLLLTAVEISKTSPVARSFARFCVAIENPLSTEVLSNYLDVVSYSQKKGYQIKEMPDSSQISLKDAIEITKRCFCTFPPEFACDVLSHVVSLPTIEVAKAGRGSQRNLNAGPQVDWDIFLEVLLSVWETEDKEITDELLRVTEEVTTDSQDFTTETLNTLLGKLTSLRGDTISDGVKMDCVQDIQDDFDKKGEESIVDIVVRNIRSYRIVKLTPSAINNEGEDKAEIEDFSVLSSYWQDIRAEFRAELMGKKKEKAIAKQISQIDEQFKVVDKLVKSKTDEVQAWKRYRWLRVKCQEIGVKLGDASPFTDKTLTSVELSPEAILPGSNLGSVKE